MDQSLGKTYKLKSRKLIKELFEKGEMVGKYPLKAVYMYCDITGEPPFKVLFSASSRQVKKATDRNRIRRLMFEAFRKNKHLLPENPGKGNKKLCLALLYLGKEGEDYPGMEKKIVLLLQALATKVENERNQ